MKKTGALAGPLIRHKITGVSPRYLDDFESMARRARRLQLLRRRRHVVQPEASRSRKAKKKSERGKPAIERESLLRITAGESVEPQAEIIPGFRSWLIEQTPDLGKAWRKSWRRIPDDGGLNIEGLAWNPLTKELLFGLRTPVIDDKPVILRVRVKNIAGTWNLNNFEMMPPVFLDLAPGDSRARHSHDGVRPVAKGHPDRDRQLRQPVRMRRSSCTSGTATAKGKVKRFDGVRFDPKFRVEGVTPGTIARPAGADLRRRSRRLSGAVGRRQETEA